MKSLLYGFEKALRELDPARFFLIVSCVLSIFYICNASYLKFVAHEKGRFLHAVHLALSIGGVPDRIPVSFIDTLSQINAPNDGAISMAANACHWGPELNAKYCHPFPPGYQNPDFLQLASIKLKPGETVPFKSYIFAVQYSFIGYIFYVLGAGIGLLFGLPPIIIMYMAIGTNALAAVALGYFTLKIMPVLRWPACYLLLSPCAFWLRSLVMPDAITIELCLLTIAIALHLFYFPRALSKKEMFSLVLLAFMTGLVKFAYFLVPVIYIIIPASCFSSARLKYVVLSLAVLASIGAGAGWATYVAKTYYPFNLTSNNPSAEAPFERKFKNVFLQPVESLGAIVSTVTSPSWMTGVVKNVIRRDNPTDAWISLLPLLLLTLLAERPERMHDMFLRGAALAIFIATLLVLCIVMYFHRDWSLKATPYLVQGRYLLPVIPCLLLAFHSTVRFSPPVQAWIKMEALWMMMVWLVWLHWFQLKIILSLLPNIF